MTLSTARKWIAIVAGFVIVVPFVVKKVSDPVVLIPLSMPLIATVAIQVRRLGAQLLARAAWWSNLALGVLFAVAGSRGEQIYTFYLVLGAGVALLAAGRGDLPAAMEQSRYAPAAFRSTLLALMVLALADASTFVLFAFIDKPGHAFALFLAIGGGLIAGFVGLLRLRLWGVVLNVLISLGAAVIIGAGIVPIRVDIAYPLAGLCVFQVIVGAPMLASIALKKPLPAFPQRTVASIAAVFIISLMLASTIAAAHRMR